MAKNKNTGLGRGLDAIFLDNATEESGKGVTMLRLADIEPRPDQPRKQFESESLSALARIKDGGTYRGARDSHRGGRPKGV